MLRSLHGISSTFLLLLISCAALAAKPVPRNPLPEPYKNKPADRWATLWYCAYSGSGVIRCQLGKAGPQSTPQPTVADPEALSVARRIIEAPQALAQRIVEIPLHAPPFEFHMAGLLAESVMCGTLDACGILFGENPDQLADLVRQHETARRAPAMLAANSRSQ